MRNDGIILFGDLLIFGFATNLGFILNCIFLLINILMRKSEGMPIFHL